MELEITTTESTPSGAETLARLEALNDIRRPAASSRPETEQPPAPSPAAAPAKPAAKGEHGPGDNWGQAPQYKGPALPPPNFDPSRPKTEAAPMGYLDDGRPWSPYGTTPGGRIRTRPSRTMQGRDPAARAAGDPADRRLAPADLKPPADVAGLYAALDDSHRRSVDLVRQIRERHPDSKLGDPIHPKAIGRGDVARTEPHFAPATIADALDGITGAIARRLGEPDAKPHRAACEDAGKKIAEASRFYGINTDPKATATATAVIALLLVFGPLILAGIGKLIDKVRGGGDA